MKVYIRSEKDGDSFYFTKCRYDEVEPLIEELKRVGGVYYEGSHRTYIWYQYVLDCTGAYVEIILGNDDEATP